MATRGKAARDPRRIYCEQYGTFWRFTLPSFLAFCREGTIKGNHNLNKFGKELRTKPEGIYKSRDSADYYGGDLYVVLFHPLDWRHGDYRQASIDIMEWWNTHGPRRKR